MKIVKVCCLLGLTILLASSFAGAEPMIAGESKIKSLGEKNFIEINFYKAGEDGCLISFDLVKLKSPMEHVGKKFNLKVGELFEKEISFPNESKKYSVEIDCLGEKVVSKINNREM